MDSPKRTKLIIILDPAIFGKKYFRRMKFFFRSDIDITLFDFKRYQIKFEQNMIGY